MSFGFIKELLCFFFYFWQQDHVYLNTLKQSLNP